MRRLLAMIVIGLLTVTGLAQENRLQQGDPPLAAHISVTTLDDMTVTITGESGAVFASAGVIVRNLYTGATETTIAAGNGSFEVTISGTDRMPYQVNAIRTLPQTITTPLVGVGTIVYPDYSNLREGQAIPFAIGGQISYGAEVWFAEGRINQLTFNADDDLSLTMTVRLFVAAADSALPYTMRGQIALRRLFDENGRQLSTAIGAGDNWSSELTPTGLPILGRYVADTLIAETTTERLFVDEETGELSFRFDFAAIIPDDLPIGIYVPVFRGQASIADSEAFDWYANRVFSTDGDNSDADSTTTIPLVLRVGDVAPLRMAWSIFEAVSSDDSANFATSNRLYPLNDNRFHTLGTYSLMPQLLGWQPMLPLNSAQIAGQPVQIITIDDAIYLWRLDKNNTLTVEDYRSDTVSVTGEVIDTFGNRYTGGGDTVLEISEVPFSNFAMRENEMWLETDSIANGVMGLADTDRNPQAWFDTRSYPTDAPDIPTFVNFPYFQGDIVFLPDGDDVGLNPVLSGGDYQYLCIVRPDVSVRHFVRDSDATFDARVSNDDLLGGQIGAGREGNRPTDVLFLFGATVNGDDIRGYSALAVVTDEDSARVVPPFTEPLFSIRDEEIYMFVLPTGVRGGQVLEIGNTFAHMGYVAPTVAADVLTEIVTPSGTVIQNETTASVFGYFYEPSQDFTVSETGIYRVYTQAIYNGITSAGQLNDTFIGYPLGADEYFVFVVPENEPMLTTPREAISTVVSGQTFTINVRAPEDWTDVEAYYTVRTASTILEQGTLDTFSNQTNYQFNWAQISRIFPNIESAATEPSDIDEITFSFAMTGLDVNGNPQIRARVFTLRGNILYTLGE
ncbi:MAG: hypothetical protein Q9P44_12160 [Anaerolineae bacterium]|nr:hypothetical protein [Anaerolineae bacterium]